VIFFQFLVIKNLDPDWIRIGIQPKMLDPDLDSMNPDPKHCFQVEKNKNKKQTLWMVKQLRE
jgi:hypothetical protein